MAKEFKTLETARVHCHRSRPPGGRWFLSTGISSGMLTITPNNISLNIGERAMNMDYYYTSSILYSYFNDGITAKELKEFFRADGIEITEYIKAKKNFKKICGDK